MKKIIVQEETFDKLNIRIEKEVGVDCYELTLGSHLTEMSKDDILVLKALIIEITES